MWRDFTYIDDIVRGILAALSHAPSAKPRHGIYNLGNHRSEKLTDFISVIEASLGKKASYRFEPMQPGDVERTYADIEASRRDLGFEPRVPISEGIPKFVEWYKTYHRIWPSN
jgi:UDP-glucuronate 4-epimerase